MFAREMLKADDTSGSEAVVCFAGRFIHGQGQAARERQDEREKDSNEGNEGDLKETFHIQMPV